MTFSSDALKAARDAGYSDDEIYSHLSDKDPRFKAVKDNGYSLDDVAAHFSKPQEVTATDSGSGGAVSAGATPAPVTPSPEDVIRETARLEQTAFGPTSVVGATRNLPHETPPAIGGGAPPGALPNVAAFVSGYHDLAETAKQWLNTPLLSPDVAATIATGGVINALPKLDTEGAGAGLQRAKETLSGFSTPMNLVQLAGLIAAPQIVGPEVAAPLIGAGFTGLMGKHAIQETVPNALEALKTHGPLSPEFGQALVSAGADVGMAAGAASTLVRPTIQPIEPNAIPIESPATQVLRDESAGGGGNVELRGVEQQNQLQVAPQPQEAAAQESVPQETITPSPLAGPALFYGEKGKPLGEELARGTIGQEHQHLMKEALANAVTRENFNDQNIQHGFVDEKGNKLDRMEAAKRALNTGLITEDKYNEIINRTKPDGKPLEDPGLTSQDLRDATEAKAKAAEAAAPTEAPVFTREEIRVGKPSVSRRKRATGTDGESVTEISAPLKVTESENWHRLSDHTKTDAHVEARIDFQTGKVPKKTDAAWIAFSGRRTAKSRTALTGRVTYDQAIEAAKDYVESSNPTPTVAEAPPNAPSEAAAAPEKLSIPKKIVRFASEVGSENAIGSGLSSAGITSPGWGKAVQGWVDAVKGAFDVAGSIKRFIKSSGQRDLASAWFDGANNKAGYIARNARRAVELGGAKKAPTNATAALEQRAATFVRQANGDKAGMLAKLNAIRGKGFDDVIDYATKHWDELQSIADTAKDMTDSAFAEADSAGVTLDYRDNYVKGAYDFQKDNKVIFDETGGGRGTGTSFKKPKVFNDYAEAIAAGFKPKELRLDMLTESAVNATLRAVNRQKWATSLESVTMPDGLKAVESPTKTGSAPRGYRMVQVTPGRLLPIHEELAPTVEALVQSSQFPRILSQAAAFVKHNLLVLDIFHGSRFGQMQAAFERAVPSYHKGLSLLEFSDADLGKAQSRGLISSEEVAWAKKYRPDVERLMDQGLNVGRISDALFSDAVPLLPGAKGANRFIFEKLSRGIITQSAITALEKNRAAHPEWTPEQLHRYTAKEVNTYYRNLGNQGIFKSKTWQDAARFFLLAPQWLEGMVRSEARGYGQMAKGVVTGKFGNISKGMGTGLLAYAALTQAINLITRGKPTWENDEPGHKFDAWVPDKIQGSGGYFISPLSVFAEMTHDAMKYTERGMEPLDVTAQLAKNKASPQMHALRDLFMGTDFFGRPLHGWQRVAQAAQETAPIPLFAKTGGYKGGAQRQIMATFGVKATPAASQTNNVYALADRFKRENNIKVPGQIEESDYAKLRRALQNGDMETAQSEYDKLRTTKKKMLVENYFRKYPEKPLTGSVSMERKFRSTLDRGQTDIYNASRREREEITRLFRTLKR